MQMKWQRILLAISLGLFVLLIVRQHSAAQEKSEAERLEEFRSAYLAGSGFSYVVIRQGDAERIYRYGDASRRTAEGDRVGYMLFTCASPHAFLARDPKARAALAVARVVRRGEPDFAELDRKYLEGCRNPLVRSALRKAR
jgi:hypothetical protein